MKGDLKDWKKRFLEGDFRALGRFISLAENKDAELFEILTELDEKAGRAQVIGITGPPGAGKSTLVAQWIRSLREQGKTVGVIAVDPVSPFTGGALLGDRIRLTDHFNDPKVFIRSLSTRGKLGGLSLATREVKHLMDAFGLDVILIETVGVGQSEVDVRKIADVAVVCLVPEWGDAVQALKAGILEIGDVFVVNKADREGADRIAAELKNVLQLSHKENTPILLTSAQDAKSVAPLFEAVAKFLSENEKLVQQRREASVKETACELLESLVAAEAREWVEKQSAKAKNPYEFLIQFRKKHPSGSLFS